MKIGTQLKTTRLLLGLTQEQFSAGIVTESYYSRVESNKSNISMDSLLKILNYNQVSLYDFFEPIISEDIDQELILGDCQFFCVNKSFRLIDSLTVF